MPGAVALHDLTVSYRDHRALHRLSGQFRPGTLTAVVGPNGAGKSTLLGALAGAIRNFEGRIERDPAARIAYLPQASALDRGFPVRVYEVVATGLWPRIGSFRPLRHTDRARIGEVLTAVGLTGFEQRVLGELSTGQVQRTLFARVLVQDAELILLDEPFNAIDARTAAELLQILKRWKEESRTVIAVLHDLEQVRVHFENALLLARESVAWGPTEEVLRPDLLARARQMADHWDEPAARYEAKT